MCSTHCLSVGRIKVSVAPPHRSLLVPIFHQALNRRSFSSTKHKTEVLLFSMYSSPKSIIVALVTLLLITGSDVALQAPDETGCTGNQISSLSFLVSACENFHRNYCASTSIIHHTNIDSAWNDDRKVAVFMSNYGNDSPCVPIEIVADFDVLETKCGTQGGESSVPLFHVVRY